MKKRILSGMRPTGPLHLGNWEGALRNWVRLQEEAECFFMIADWHALTTDYEDTSDLPKNIRAALLDFLAAGLDPEKCAIFRQSHVPEHAELALLLSMVTPLGWLERNPTYKEQLRELKGREIRTHGFLGYPVLQAADILLYRATHVPVGEDQLPHLELTREIARRFNRLYGDVFPEPQAMLTPSPRVPGLDGRKMSKTYGNAIYLSDSPAAVREKVKTMFTDPNKIRQKDKGHPEPCPENPTGCAVFALHKVYSDYWKRRRRECEEGEIGCVACKGDLTKSLEEALVPLRLRRQRYAKNEKGLEEILAEGARKARAAASSTLSEVRRAMNLIP